MRFWKGNYWLAPVWRSSSGYSSVRLIWFDLLWVFFVQWKQILCSKMAFFVSCVEGVMFVKSSFNVDWWNNNWFCQIMLSQTIVWSLKMLLCRQISGIPNWTGQNWWEDRVQEIIRRGFLRNESALTMENLNFREVVEASAEWVIYISVK